MDITVPTFVWAQSLRPHLLEGCYIHVSNTTSKGDVRWFRSDFTPVLLADVPKELILLELLHR